MRTLATLPPVWSPVTDCIILDRFRRQSGVCFCNANVASLIYDDLSLASTTKHAIQIRGRCICVLVNRGHGWWSPHFLCDVNQRRILSCGIGYP